MRRIRGNDAQPGRSTVLGVGTQHGLCSQADLAASLGCPMTYCVTLAKLLKFSEPSSLTCKMTPGTYPEGRGERCMDNIGEELAPIERAQMLFVPTPAIRLTHPSILMI